MLPPLNLLQQTIDHVVARLDSLEVSQLIADLPENIEEAAEAFCDRFELGTWFIEALNLNEADIGSMLSRLANERMDEEADDAVDRRIRERDLQTF